MGLFSLMISKRYNPLRFSETRWRANIVRFPHLALGQLWDSRIIFVFAMKEALSV